MPSAIMGPFAAVVEDAATTLQNAAGGTGNGTAFTFDPSHGAFTLLTSGGIGTIVPEVSFDSGGTWQTLAGSLITTLAVVTSVVTTVAQQVHTFTKPVGATSFRARISAFVSGSITATITPVRNAR